MLVRLDGVEQGQAEGGRLAGAGLGDTHDVLAREQYRNGLALDRGGGLVAHVGDGLEKVRRQPEIGEGDLLRGFDGRSVIGVLTGRLVPAAGLEEGRAAVDVVLARLLIPVADPLVLGVDLGEGEIDIIGFLVVLNVLGVLRGVRGSGSGEDVGGSGRGRPARVRRSYLLRLLPGGDPRRGAGGGDLGVEEVVEAGRIAHGPLGGLGGARIGGGHDVLPVSGPLRGPLRSVGEDGSSSTLAAPHPPHSSLPRLAPGG